ncbi:hypothetical protein L0F81_27275 [Streptomyces tricolor]|uniref:Uncharacterized protein n=1 Tax=Streptomyces tricolor TaxID=68277 RepID=A0ABS9JMX7_9ACTN|nr:GTPase-associated protein 1-related protein [Streptomyces tricolor]MCG0066922.1 hypothetical protein [Streptomyces tricolor]
MSLAQLHYTSAPPGPDGSGFRFTAVSPGVPATLLREAEQLIGYEPPRDLPDRPDAEQLKSFPKAFSCTELSDGGRLLCRSVYTGADYSGRWGNFHAHAVHLPPGTRLPDGALPITVWESPRWAEATPPGGRPEPVDRIEPSRLLRRDGLVAFARSRADRLAAFFADLRTLADGSDVRQLVLVERDSADVAQWIALACTVLPREQAHRLTFTTYTRRPQQARQQIVGALPSSEPVGHDHRFRVHDCTGRAAGEPVADAWAEVCARIWTAGRPELFRDTARDLGDTADDVGRLAVTALAGGIALPPAARAAAARRAAARAGDLPEPTLTALLGELARAADGDDGSAGSEEPAALAALLARLDGHVPTAVSAPLAARVLTLAVRGRGPVPALGAGSLTAEVRAALARDLAPALRHGIADPDGPATGRPLSLLHLADLLDVDCTDLLPEFAGRIARELVRTEPAHETPDAVVPGSAGARSAAAGPEAPGSAVPGSAVPRSEMPGPAWPRPTHPGSDHPAPGQPGTARAGASLSGTSRPGSARPEAAQQGPARPGADHPRSAQPGTSGPGSGRPGSADSPPPCPPALHDARRGPPAPPGGGGCASS